MLLSAFCFLFTVRARDAALLGTVAALATSVLDRFLWDWFNHFGYVVALFGIPILSGGTVILILRYIKNHRQRAGSSSDIAL